MANSAQILTAAISFAAAGEEFAQMEEAGHAWPAILTSIIATILTVWGLYALSAAAVIRKLPLIKTALTLLSPYYK